MGVAVKVRQSTLDFISLSLSLSLTPKRCSSSNHKEAEVVPFNVFLKEAMGTDDEIDLALLEAGYGLSLFLLLDEAGEHGHVDGKGLEALAKILEVLLREDRRGGEEGDLLPRDGGLETGAHGYLRLAIADIAADEAVHGLGALHIGFNLFDTAQLVGGLVVGEGSLEGQLPILIGGKGIALGRPTPCVDANEAFGKFLNRFPDLALPVLPGLGSQTIEARGLSLASDVALDQIGLFDGHEDGFFLGVFDFYIVSLVSEDAHAFYRGETPDAVIDMDDEIAGREFDETVDAGRTRVLHRLGHSFTPAENLPFLNHEELEGGQREADGDAGRLHKDLVVLQEGGDSLGLGLGLGEDPDLVAGLDEGNELFLEILNISEKGSRGLGPEPEPPLAALIVEGRSS